MINYTLLDESNYINRIAQPTADDLYTIEQMNFTSDNGPSQRQFWTLSPAQRLTLYADTIALNHRWNADERAALVALVNKHLNALRG